MNVAALNDDNLLLKQEFLSGVHEDAVDCIYHTRLTRLKSLQNEPDEQLSAFSRVVDDAYDFWKAVSCKPEKTEGRRDSLSLTLEEFFSRVVRYAEFHENTNLTPTQINLKHEVIQQAEEKKASLTL